MSGGQDGTLRVWDLSKAPSLPGHDDEGEEEGDECVITVPPSIPPSLPPSLPYSLTPPLNQASRQTNKHTYEQTDAYREGRVCIPFRDDDPTTKARHRRLFSTEARYRRTD